MPDFGREGDDWDPIDESTAVVEKRIAEGRLEAAETGAQRTSAAVRAWQILVSEVSEMHHANDFARRLRPLYQGSNRG